MEDIKLIGYNKILGVISILMFCIGIVAVALILG